ncbi:hypothetical protein [Aurantimonas sp. 22II-16-19i]|uniref:hypothetical protein n=1 Tax=Aurantimonas sp. 22II-16-19i TaxID=1317114 RepID=UPI0009F7A63F|nr:hypothetical protein [Aurantimonas sp. 22II-16-19i]ORE87736.1 hypothetical protein ATO4_25318 [Aurantimonas sp. 22II-16-19i]
MALKRYRLVNSDERLPYRGREFRADGETMEDSEAFTRRLLKEGCIAEIEPADDGGDRKSTKSKGAA